ncbi:hypothetical protein ACWPM1_12095 [Tsuneonella sp. HG249]
MAGLMIVSSQGPSADRFRVGTVIPEDSDIVLRKGDEITLLDSGGTISLKGPAHLKDISRRQSHERASVLAVLTREARSKRTRIAAARDYRNEVQQALVADSQAASRGVKARRSMAPTIWHIDPSLPGTWCYLDPEVEIWRADAKEGYELYFSSPHAERILIRWSQGENFAFWPYRAPLADGVRYFVQAPNKYEHYITVREVQIGQKLADTVELARLLSENECYYQFDLLTG